MDTQHNLSEFLADHKAEIIARWAARVQAVLSLCPDHAPQLIDDLPVFLDDLVVSLREGSERANHRAAARAHGRQRKEMGVDIGALVVEFGLIAETILEIAVEHDFSPGLTDIGKMFRMISQGTEQSVTEYAALRDREIGDEAAQHYSLLAHEMRTPLQNARLATTLLAQGVGDPKTQIERLARSIDAVAAVVDDSLVRTRLRTHPTPRYEPLDARTLLADAAEVCSAAAARRKIDIQIDCEPFAVEADRKLAGSMLVNLVSNAIKFTPEGRTVVLRGRKVEDRARFEIQDECGGMPADLPGRLFQPHVQEGRDRSGFGLGLVIVKQVVDMHAGTIRVNNDPGSGCCFVVDLPLAELAEP